MKLLYVYDALCGWCYGFSTVIVSLSEQLELDCEVISGGMVTDDRIGPIGEVAGYISEAYKDVEKRTGVTFGTDFLEGTLAEGTAIFTSIPAAIALCIFKEYQPEKQLAFATDLKKAIYYDGLPPAETTTYSTIAARYGMNTNDFLSKMEDPKYSQLAQQDFAISKQLQVTGFPTLFLVDDRKAIPISQGYSTLEVCLTNYKNAIEVLEG